MGRVWITWGGVNRASGEVDLAVRLDELAAHHEEDEELKDHVDERGHIDPGIYASFASDEDDLGAREEAFAEMGGELVEVMDELIDTGLKDLSHGHGGDGDEEAGNGGEKAGPDAIGKV